MVLLKVLAEPYLAHTRAACLTCLMTSLPAVAICGCMLSMIAARPAGGRPENNMLSLMAVSVLEQ